MTEHWSSFESIQESAADPVYGAWLAENLPRKADLLRMAETWQSFSDRPLISIVMPVYNPPASFLKQAIESVLAQIYPQWELCVADDASTQPYVREILQSYATQDDRIKIIFRSENGHISACSNSALELATGEFVALLDHDDLLAPDALYEVVRLLNQHPAADMFYSDEDKVDEQGKLKDPFFKPDWSPDSFLSRMYTCHFGVYRRSLVNQIGGFRIGYEGSQDYDLVLRLIEKTDQIFHIPKILYHWRIHNLSAASGVAAKPYAVNAAENALNDALVRRKENGQVKQVGNLGAYIPRYQITQPQTVSVILFSPQGSTALLKDTDAKHEKISALIHADLKNSDLIDVEVISVRDQGPKKYLSQEAVLSTVSGSSQTQQETNDLGWIAALNQAVGAAKGDYLCFLQDTIEPIGSGWIAALLEQAQRRSIGCASGLLLRPDQTVLHAGIVLGLGGLAGYPHRDVLMREEELGYHGQLISVNNYAAVTGTCMMCHRAKFELVGGFTEAAGGFYDIDFCLKLGEKGFRHVFLPHVKLCDYGAMAHKMIAPTSQARSYLQERWAEALAQDPYYNRNFSRSQPYALKVDGHVRANDQDFNLLAFRVYDMKFLLQEKQEKLESVRGRLRQKGQEVEQLTEALAAAQQRIAAMETSKFWKIRTSWFKVKKRLNLPSNE